MTLRLLRDVRLPLILIALALAGLTFWSLHRFRRYQPLADFGPAERPSSLDNIGLQINGATVTGREGGQLRWRVACRTITLSHDHRRVTVDGISKGVLYDTGRHPAVSVSAGHATYRTFFGELMQGGGPPAAGVLRLFGGIQAHVMAGPGVTLQGDSLTWDALHNSVTCPGQVQARFTAGNAVGEDLTVDAHNGDLSLRRLHGTFLLPAEVEGIMLRRPSSHAALMVGGSLALAGVAAHAATPPTQQYVTYDAGFSRWLNAPHTVEMSQGVTFTQDDAFLKTQAAVVNLDGQQRALNAKSQSPVHLYNTQDDLTGKQGYIDFTRHLATLQDNIVLVVKPGATEASAPKGSARSNFQDPATLTCSQMTYDYRRKLGHVPGALTIHQKDRVLTADSGEYDASKETVTLVGHVHGHNGTDEIQTTKVVVLLTEGAESITIPVPTHGRWVVKDQDEPEPTPDTPTAPRVQPAPTSSPSDTPMTPNSPPPIPPTASPN